MSQSHPIEHRMGKRHRRRTIAVAGLTAVLALAGCASSGGGGASNSSASSADGKILGAKKVATGTPVKVGFVTAEGGASLDLHETREAAQATVQYANEHLGGIAGHPIELDTCKDKSDGASGTACANQFVSDKVAAVVVGQVANTDLYIPILSGAGIPWVAETGAGQAELTSNLSFDLGGGLISILAASAQYAKDHNLKHVVAFGIDVPAFTGLFNTIGKAAFKKAGVEIDLVTLPPGTPDATPQVTSGFQRHPDGVMVFAEKTLCKALMPAIHTANTKNATLLVSGLCTTKDVIASIGEASVAGAIVNGNNVSLGNDAEAQLFRAVMTTYGGASLANGDGATGYVATLGLVRAMNQTPPTGPITAATVATTLRQAKNVPMPGIPDAVFTCDGTAIPGLKAVCSNGTLFATVSGSSLIDFRMVDGSSLLK